MRESRWAFTPYIWVVRVCGCSELPLKRLRLRVRPEAAIVIKSDKNLDPHQISYNIQV